MKTEDKVKIEKADRLALVILERKKLQKEEEELKKFFETEYEKQIEELPIKEKLYLEAGSTMVEFKKGTRDSLDREKLEAEFGVLVVTSKYTKTSVSTSITASLKG